MASRGTPKAGRSKDLWSLNLGCQGPFLRARLARMPQLLDTVKLALLDPFFHQCLAIAAQDAEFVAQFDRLTGNHLSAGKTPIERMVDDACGRTDSGLKEFLEFVYETVYIRVPRDSTIV